MMMYDDLGKRYDIISEKKLNKLSGKGGYMALSRVDCSIRVNNTTLEFALRSKFPAMLYINGKPVVDKILYLVTRGDDGYYYAIYFDGISYDYENINDLPSLVRTMNAKVVKCLPSQSF